jgi:hypothetical protein
MQDNMTYSLQLVLLHMSTQHCFVHSVMLVSYTIEPKFLHKAVPHIMFGKYFEVLAANTWPLQIIYQQFFNIY